MGSTTDTHDTTEQPGNGIGMDHLVGENIESKIMDDGVVSYGNGTGNATEKVSVHGANPGSNCKSPLVDSFSVYHARPRHW